MYASRVTNTFPSLGLVIFICAALLRAISASGADVEDIRKLYETGRYAEAASDARELVGKRRFNEEAQVLLAKSLLATGLYQEAEASITNGLGAYSRSARLKMLAYDVFSQTGQKERAKEILTEINQMARTRYNNFYRDPHSLVALGRAVLLMGADPKLVLENFFNEAKNADPTLREAYLAIGNLSLDKNDYALAAQAFQEGVTRFPNDPDIHYGLARAFAPSERPKMAEHLTFALERNERHVPSLLLLVDHQIDAEEYKTAESNLDKVLKVNPSHPEAWAYRAVIAHLQNNKEREKESREKALKVWNKNPRVAHLIGLKLSQKYRFAEGSIHQREALSWDPDYLPAKIQLAQDLLRLGKNDEGWKLAQEVHDADGYDVTAYNLVTLNETLADFQTIKTNDFIVRMHPREAAIYGNQVMELLQKAKEKLTKKYGLELEQPTIIEIFPEQKDFAVRTFGMPGGEGFLGVCFGCLVTANSPASQLPSPANWKAVLWHEFCHVITLSMTKNKMPRWLSEGISVYEERQENPSWGQVMTPEYRQMVLNGELTPVSELSGAFLAPKTPQHLQFAYYESSLVVEYLINNFGLEALRKILADLAQGHPINDVIAKHTAPMPQIEEGFETFAKQRARELAPELEWKKVEELELADGETEWVAKHPKNFWVLKQHAKRLLEEKKWEEAKAPLQQLITQYPDQADPDNAYALIAIAHRALNETEQERTALSKWALQDADSLDAYARLMELASGTKDWPAVIVNGERYLAVNPLSPLPYRYLARAYEEAGRESEAIERYKILARLDTTDSVGTHFRLAKLLHRQGKPEAKRHVLQALEEAPRFREAHQLLLQISKPSSETNSQEKPKSVE